jgi:hypothetical protein
MTIFRCQKGPQTNGTQHSQLLKISNNLDFKNTSVSAQRWYGYIGHTH